MLLDATCLRSADEPTRRRFLVRAAQTCLGVTLAPFASPMASTLAAAAPSSSAKAKQVIYLFMEGAMSQLDSFDPKPFREVQAHTNAIQTSVSCIQLSKY